MKPNKLIINNTSDRKQIKRVHEQIVKFLIIFVKAFLTEVEETGHLSAFVVASKEKNIVLMTNLYG